MKLGLDWSDGEPEDVVDLEKEGGGFYEDIEAPKFVDFTVPDRSRPDDRSWFCDRIGCDQNHEEVDPEALYKSFVLRVMAARSPNVRLQKAVGASSLIFKCPQSAPVKTGKSRIIMSTMTSVPEKIVKTRLNHHQITKLRLTPSSKMENEQNSTAKKAFTMPGNKRCQNKPEPFRSVRVKNQKTLVTAPKNKNVVKVLFNDSTKDITEISSPSKNHTTTVSEICTEMKKLQFGSKIVPSRYLDISKGARPLKKTEDSTTKSTTAKESGKSLRITNDPKNICRKKNAHSSEGCNLSLLQEIRGKKSDDMEKDANSINRTRTAAALGENDSSFPAMLANEASQSTIASSRSSNMSRTAESKRKTEDNEEEREKALLDQVSIRLTSEIQTAVDTNDYDENKENASAHDGARSPGSIARNCTRKKMQSVATESYGKTCIFDSKPCKHPLDQGWKVKMTTNTKPFRLRTYERGILKEANMGRRFKTNTKTEAEPIMKLDERFKHKGKAPQEKKNKTCLVDGQILNAQLDQPYAKFGIPADSKLIPEKLLTQKSIASYQMTTKKPHNKVQALPSSSSTLMSSYNKPQSSRNRKESNKARNKKQIM